MLFIKWQGILTLALSFNYLESFFVSNAEVYETEYTMVL